MWTQITEKEARRSKKWSNVFFYLNVVLALTNLFFFYVTHSWVSATIAGILLFFAWVKKKEIEKLTQVILSFEQRKKGSENA